MIIIKLIISPKERQKFSFLTNFSFILTFFRVEIGISYHFHKIRLKCEILSPTFTREKGPISCLSWEKDIKRRLFGVLALSETRYYNYTHSREASRIK